MRGGFGRKCSRRREVATRPSVRLFTAAMASTDMADSRNGASFHDRFVAAAHLNIGALNIVLEQTCGERSPDESHQATVWTAATVLAAAIHAGKIPVADASVVELGAGTGLVGIVAAASGANDVTLTDYPALLPLLARNAAANGVDCAVHGFVWGDDAPYTWRPEPTVILGSDIAVFVQSLPDLVKAIEHLAAPRNASMFMAHHDRGDIESMLAVFAPRFTYARCHEEGDEVHIYCFKLREDRGEVEEAAEMDEATMMQAKRGDLKAMKAWLAKEAEEGGG